MLVTCKIHLMQRLKQAYAVFLRDSVANHQMPVPNSCLSPFAPPSNTSSHNRIKTTTKNYFISILAHLFPINLNINCYYYIKIIETIQ
jgi:hypothetical protein